MLTNTVLTAAFGNDISLAKRISLLRVTAVLGMGRKQDLLIMCLYVQLINRHIFYMGICLRRAIQFTEPSVSPVSATSHTSYNAVMFIRNGGQNPPQTRSQLSCHVVGSSNYLLSNTSLTDFILFLIFRKNHLIKIS